MSSIVMKHRSTLISVLTFLSVIVVVQYVWGWNTLLSFWKSIPATALISFTLLYWFSYLVRSYRISIYFNNARVKLPTKVVLPIVVKQTFWANLLPAKAGEISFPILMKRAFATPYTHSVPALLVLRLFDAYVLGSIAVAIFAYSALQGWVLAWLALAFFIPQIGIVLRRRLIGLSYKYRRKNKAKFVWQILSKIPASRSKLFNITALSWLNWAVKIVLFAALLASMTPLIIEQTALAALFGEVSGMLPGLPGGFGSYEAAVSFGLMSAGAELNGENSALIVAAALNSHFFILFNSILGAMIVFMLPKRSLIETNI